MLVVSTAALVSCAQTSTVQVIDSKTKRPVSGASVKAVNGNYYSGNNYTDANGATAEPTLPFGNEAIEIKRSGYTTTRVKY